MTALWLALAAHAAAPVVHYDFSKGPEGAVPGGDTLQWAWSAQPAAGPGGASWGTNPDGQYLHDATDTLALALPSIHPASRPTLIVEHGYDLVAGDAAFVEGDDGTGWVVLQPIAGYPTANGFGGDSNGWRVDAFDLSGVGPLQAMRFRLTSDLSQAADGWYVASVELYDSDVIPPSLTPLVVPSDTQDLDGPYGLQLAVRDTAGVASVVLHWSSTAGEGGDEAMEAVGGDVFEAALPGQPAGAEVTWWVEASDGVQVSTYPEGDPAGFRVFLAAPTGVEAVPPAPRVATELALTWAPPVSPHPVEGYRVEEIGGAAIEVEGPPAVLPLTPGAEQRFVVTADYGPLGDGDPSLAYRGAVEVPMLDPLQPDLLAPGAVAWVQVDGEGLYLLEGVSTFDLGAGVSVVDAEVLDVGAATLRVEVAADATLGPRDLVLMGAQGEARFADVFEVGVDDRLPRVLEVVPDALTQGREATIRVSLSHDVGDGLTTELPEGLVLTRPAVADGPREVTVPLAAAVDARPGTYTVVLDDGEALYPFSLRIDPYDAGPQKSCGVAPAAGGWLGWCLVFGAFRRRRAR